MYQPRPISRAIRYGVSGILALLSVPLLYLGVHGYGGWGTVVALGLVQVVISLTISNIGVRPRVQGRYLDVITLLGRQSLDLNSLTGASYHRSRSTVSVRLRDPITDVTIVVPAGASVHEAIREGLRAAGQRGVVVPKRVAVLFGLQAMPGAPMVFAFLTGAALVGLVAGFLVRT
ncbi:MULTISPECIES: hypothetical protein [unclassified Kribbella]|uniref:hypothetical protein n=1 Tax=unclassified Kribbella TaxID=2644121 RepID=UPI00301955F0